MRKAAVITGQHSFEVEPFQKLFGSFARWQCIVQHLDDFTASSAKVRRSYDVLVFYAFPTQNPEGREAPWWRGNPSKALQELGKTSQGIVLLHHSIVAYPNWPFWDSLVGIKNRDFSCHFDQTLLIEPLKHEISAGLALWRQPDETYEMKSPGSGSGCTAVLRTRHPKSMKTLAWTKKFRKSRVFCLQSGHDSRTWEHESFREILLRGMNWVAPTS